MDVLLVIGWLPPSAGHGRRMVKILRSESRRQIRHFKDCLKVACSSASEGRLNVKAFREWHRQASITTEALWNDVRRNLPKKKTEVPEGCLLILEGAKVDRKHQEVLKCGPKYCVEPRLSIVDKLALTRDIARSVPENEKERCVVECVDVIAKVEAKGVCIGSKVAPILSTIFLASIDRELDEELEGITYNIYSAHDFTVKEGQAAINLFFNCELDCALELVEVLQKRCDVFAADSGKTVVDIPQEEEQAGTS
ncbi:hypothetical protein HPB50_015542 [Hyalomma asiaticum]|uniref:Uncharacterized protein n=1 Tax=Hyalomma asiaticum TaxID=266040 RepID=A0ACB7RUN5_HYAAI|nr:hypothetical protein HPB50_015542 [Hyalomma asiaticum]